MAIVVRFFFPSWPVLTGPPKRHSAMGGDPVEPGRDEEGTAPRAKTLSGRRHYPDAYAAEPGHDGMTRGSAHRIMDNL